MNYSFLICARDMEVSVHLAITKNISNAFFLIGLKDAYSAATALYHKVLLF